MGRKTRTIATHTLYHITARGNNREALFLSDKDRETYLGLWRKYRTELEFDVYAYVLMTNHGDKNFTRRILKRVELPYSQYGNSTTGTSTS